MPFGARERPFAFALLLARRRRLLALAGRLLAFLSRVVGARRPGGRCAAGAAAGAAARLPEQIGEPRLLDVAREPARDQQRPRFVARRRRAQVGNHAVQHRRRRRVPGLGQQLFRLPAQLGERAPVADGAAA